MVTTPKLEVFGDHRSYDIVITTMIPRVFAKFSHVEEIKLTSGYSTTQMNSSASSYASDGHSYSFYVSIYSNLLIYTRDSLE